MKLIFLLLDDHLMKPFTIALVALFALLQYQIWFGEGNVYELRKLKKSIVTQKQSQEEAELRNKALLAQIQALKTDKEEIEQRARVEHNMVKSDERFYQVVD